MSVALGAHADSILVASAAVCRQCVAYLKQHQIEPMTFIPLHRDDLRVAPPPDPPAAKLPRFPPWVFGG